MRCVSTSPVTVPQAAALTKYTQFKQVTQDLVAEHTAGTRKYQARQAAHQQRRASGCKCQQKPNSISAEP